MSGDPTNDLHLRLLVVISDGARHGLWANAAQPPLQTLKKAFTNLRYRLFGLFTLGEPYQVQIRFYYHLRIAV